MVNTITSAANVPIFSVAILVAMVTLVTRIPMFIVVTFLTIFILANKLISDYKLLQLLGRNISLCKYITIFCVSVLCRILVQPPIANVNRHKALVTIKHYHY